MIDQGEVIAFLSDGRAFDLPDHPVERIDTHAAIVFLIGDHAHKLKRAVRYSFLDFSTIEKRRHILEREYRLNIRTAPELYRGLIPVTCDAGGNLALEGEGEIVDWLLEMRRFDQTALLDHLAEQGRLDAPLIQALAAEIADLHEKAPARSGGGHAAMESIADGNAEDLASLAGEIGASDVIALLIEATQSELSRQRERLDRRADAGFVRHCHGDLHLGNIFLDGDRPVLFDCLEFDEALATIDVFYDLAFLLMDLCHRGLDDFAIDLLNAYLDCTEDDEGAALLLLFLAIRATIRAKIEGFEIKTAESAADASKHRLAATQYIDLAKDLLDAGPPSLIAIGGLSGSGKSTVARLLAHRLGRKHWPVMLRSDVMRKTPVRRQNHDKARSGCLQPVEQSSHLPSSSRSRGGASSCRQHSDRRCNLSRSGGARAHPRLSCRSRCTFHRHMARCAKRYPRTPHPWAQARRFRC